MRQFGQFCKRDDDHNEKCRDEERFEGCAEADEWRFDLILCEVEGSHPGEADKSKSHQMCQEGKESLHHFWE